MGLISNISHLRIVSPRPFHQIRNIANSGHKRKRLKPLKNRTSTFSDSNSGQWQPTGLPRERHTVLNQLGQVCAGMLRCYKHACGASGRLSIQNFALEAQLDEQVRSKDMVEGSTPSRSTTFGQGRNRNAASRRVKIAPAILALRALSLQNNSVAA